MSDHVYSRLMLHVQFRSPRMSAQSLQISLQNHLLLIPTYVIRISLFPPTSVFNSPISHLLYHPPLFLKAHVPYPYLLQLKTRHLKLIQTHQSDPHPVYSRGFVSTYRPDRPFCSGPNYLSLSSQEGKIKKAYS